MEKNKESHKMFDRLDAISFVRGEMVKGKGEDGFVIGANEALVIAGVFDGCGGLGAKQYSVFDGHTGAYIGARAVAGAVYDWFARLDENSSPKAWGPDIKEAMRTGLAAYKSMDNGQKGLKGSMTKDFPTTASFSVCRQSGEGEEIHFFWAGDSRGYLLTEKGLAQVTADDTDGEDAMSNLHNDGVLNNVISASADFVLHEKEVFMGGAYVMLNSTDGYFNYLPSPMHFEYLLLDTLRKADSIKNWEERLAKEVRGYTGDDHTLCMAVFGYGTFDNLQLSYKERLAYLDKNYIALWSSSKEEERQMLWRQYQSGQEKVLEWAR